MRLRKYFGVKDRACCDWRPAIRTLIAAGAAWLTVLFGVSLGHAQTPDSSLWCLAPGDNILACARSGNTLYVGGNFSKIGPCTGGGVPVNASTGAPQARYPRVAGYVDVALPDGSGGWYIAGKFTGVGGCARTNLAHIRPDGEVDKWAPNPNREVRCIARLGQALYVGGDFDSLGGVRRQGLASLPTNSSYPLAWDPQANDHVNALVVVAGKVFAAGRFTNIGGLARNFVAAMDPVSGSVSLWDASVDGEILCLAASDTTLLLGGYFSRVGGAAHACVAKVGISIGGLVDWNPVIYRAPNSWDGGNPNVSALLVDGGRLVIAGAFTSVGGADRQGLAAIDVATASVLAWDPRARFSQPVGPSFWSLAKSATSIFVAGSFDSIGGRPGSKVASLDATSASAAAWDPRPNDFIVSLAASESVVYLGGRFNSLGDGANRSYLAAIDTQTGRPTSWNPVLDGYVTALTAYGGTVYVSGYFGSVNGQGRAGLAAVDSSTGALTPWDPAPDGLVNTIAVTPNRVLLGGRFTHVGGASRRYIAAVDTATGGALAWDPAANDIVTTLVPTDSVIYAGGWFSSIGGQPRASLAALDPATGQPTPWDPGTDGVVMSLASGPGVMFVGGIFGLVGGLPRTDVAAIDLSGRPTSWVADANERVLAIVVHDSTVFAGGFFTSVGGQPRASLAALNLRTGAVEPWRLDTDTFVWALSSYQNTLYVGGNFTWIGESPQDGIAAVPLSSAPTKYLAGIALLSQNIPNPTRGSAEIHYSLQADASVSLTIYDLQGRRVESVLSRVFQFAGPHQMVIRTTGLQSGCYLYRLEAGGLSSTRKMVVIQ